MPPRFTRDRSLYALLPGRPFHMGYLVTATYMARDTATTAGPVAALDRLCDHANQIVGSESAILRFHRVGEDQIAAVLRDLTAVPALCWLLADGAAQEHDLGGPLQVVVAGGRYATVDDAPTRLADIRGSLRRVWDDAAVTAMARGVRGPFFAGMGQDVDALLTGYAGLLFATWYAMTRAQREIVGWLRTGGSQRDFAAAKGLTKQAASRRANQGRWHVWKDAEAGFQAAIQLVGTLRPVTPLAAPSTPQPEALPPAALCLA